MNKILYIFLILLGETFFAQNSNDFEKIIFEYNHKHEYGNNKEKFSKEEFFELTKLNNENYNYKNNIQIIKTYNGKIIKSKTNKFKNLINIDKKLIMILFNELSTNKDNFTFEYIKPKLNKPKISLIEKIIKEKNFILKIENKQLIKEQRKKIITEILTFNLFDKFIEFEKPKPNGLYGMTDGYENLKISFISKKDTVIYKSETYHKCGQPINVIKKNSEKYKIINLEVNTQIENILPKKSLFRNQFNLNNITEKYIRWYLDNNI